MGAVKEAVSGVKIQCDAEIPTWFGIGGRADRLAHPANVDELKACLREEPNLRILGDGANLLVDDEGVAELVVSLNTPAFTGWTFDDKSSRVQVMAGANLPKLITEAVRRGRAGLEGLAGIPATIGGALVMNAGGAFGQIADSVVRVHALTRQGAERTLERDEIDFSYRHSGLEDLIITSAVLDLPEEDPAALRTRLKEVMEYKKRSQPMADRSAGCVFKNPLLPHDLREIGQRGERVSAGMLIDRAGCKGMRCASGGDNAPGATVSERHANFMVTCPPENGRPGTAARDVIELMETVRGRVRAVFGVTLEPEVVVWHRTK